MCPSGKTCLHGNCCPMIWHYIDPNGYWACWSSTKQSSSSSYEDVICSLRDIAEILLILVFSNNHSLTWTLIIPKTVNWTTAFTVCLVPLTHLNSYHTQDSQLDNGFHSVFSFNTSRISRLITDWLVLITNSNMTLNRMSLDVSELPKKKE
jgi:hypothetical protein